MKLLLFDIDGTLLIGHGAGTRAMTRAGKAICGEAFSLDGVMIGGGLDPVIFSNALRKQGRDADADLHEAFRERYLLELETELATAARKAELLPGVVALLDALQSRDDVVIGLVTGNYRRAVPIKFGAVGLAHEPFVVGAFGDDAPSRPELVRIAMGLCPRRVLPRDTIVIGDTPRDVDCAHANGCVCLAVATGTHPLDELRATGADCAVEDLRDPSPLFELLER